MPVSAEDFALFTQQNIGQLRKGLALYYKLCISVIRMRWKYNFTRHKLFDANRHTLVTRRGCCYTNEKNGLTKTFFADEIAALFVLQTTIRERS